MRLDAYCDRCDSDNVTIRCTDKIEKPERVPMSELPHVGNISAVPLLMKYSNYRADCEDCGHFVEWSE